MAKQPKEGEAQPKEVEVSEGERDKVLIAKQARLEKIRLAARELVDRDRPTPELLLRQASEVASEKIQSIFGGRLVRGAFQLMVGPGEAGKGMVSADIIARMSTGVPFPGEGNQTRPPLSTVVCVTEDSAARVKARLVAAGANLSNIYFVDGPPAMRGGLIVPSPIAFDSDAGALLNKIRDRGIAALFLETTVEHLGDRENKKQWSTNNEAEVRRALAPLVAVCREGGIIGWGIMHPRKSKEGGIEDSISGSAAFRNTGRGVMNVYKDPMEEATGTRKNPWRLLLSSKANYLATRPPTLRFRVESWDLDPTEGRVVWGIEKKNLIDERSAEDVWRQIHDLTRNRRDYSVRDAEVFLRKLLKEGMKTLADIKKACEEDGHSWRAIERAKDNLRVESVKQGFPAKVVGWKLGAENLSDDSGDM